MTANFSRFRTRQLLATLLLLAPAATPRAVAFERPDSLAEWQAQLGRTLTSHGQPKVRFAAQVVDLATGQTLYEHDAHLPMIPASNQKLMVMAAAVHRLGPDFQFRTVLAVRGKDLVVVGSGDPTMGDERLAALRGEPITAVFHQWAAKLTTAGVKQIPGRIVIDDSIFDRQFVHPNWPKDQFQAWYEAPVGGLNFSDNCYDVIAKATSPGRPAVLSLSPGNVLIDLVNKTKTGSKSGAWLRRTRGKDEVVVSGPVAGAVKLGPTTVCDPGLFFGHVLKTVLAAKGIRVVGGVAREKVKLKADGSPEGSYVVAIHTSPLADALARAGQNSLGMMAEALLKRLGASRGVGSWASGREALQAFFDEAGVAAGEVKIDDGSGLSRHNRLSPAAAMRVLQFVASRPEQLDLLRRSLARPGREGTLKRRMRGPATKDRVFAKTGYINGVRTLSGLVDAAGGRRLAFAFFYDHAVKTRPLTAIQDKACEILVSLPPIAGTRASADNELGLGDP